MPPPMPFTLIKKGFAFGGTAMTFLFGALIFSRDKEPRGNSSSSTEEKPQVTAVAKVPVVPPIINNNNNTSVTSVTPPTSSSWGSFLGKLFGSSTPAPLPSKPAPVVPVQQQAAAVPGSASASAEMPANKAVTPAAPSGVEAGALKAEPSIAEQQKPKSDMWQHLQERYEGQFYEAVKNGDTESAAKFSKLIIEAKKRA